jgi:hypothetical protein
VPPLDFGDGLRLASQSQQHKRERRAHQARITDLYHLSSSGLDSCRTENRIILL